MIKYILWNFDNNTPYNTEIYETIQGAKGAANYTIKWKPVTNLGIMQVRLEFTDTSYKKVNGTWLELKGIAKLLYK